MIWFSVLLSALFYGVFGEPLFLTGQLEGNELTLRRAESSLLSKADGILRQQLNSVTAPAYLKRVVEDVLDSGETVVDAWGTALSEALSKLLSKIGATSALLLAVNDTNDVVASPIILSESVAKEMIELEGNRLTITLPEQLTAQITAKGLKAKVKENLRTEQEAVEREAELIGVCPGVSQILSSIIPGRGGILGGMTSGGASSSSASSSSSSSGSSTGLISLLENRTRNFLHTISQLSGVAADAMPTGGGGGGGGSLSGAMGSLMGGMTGGSMTGGSMTGGGMGGGTAATHELLMNLVSLLSPCTWASAVTSASS